MISFLEGCSITAKVKKGVCEIFVRFSHARENARPYYLPTILSLCLITISHLPTLAIDSWEKLDKHLKGQVCQLNIGLKLRLKEGLWADLADLSLRYRLPVFSTTTQDKGYRVVGFGSSFPIKTSHRDRMYFLTSRHVVASSVQIIEECQRFYAAMHLYAEKTAFNQNVNDRYKELLEVVNRCRRKNMSSSDRSLYHKTVDAIWDVYESCLSTQADPERLLFRKYNSLAYVTAEVGFFLHPPGPVTQVPLKAMLYKMAKSYDEPDLAVLTVSSSKLQPLEFDLTPPSEGQEIQVIGYPAASDQIDLDSSKYYAPTFSTGRISRVSERMLQVDAPITTGNSGGPVVSQKGKVLGVVTVRAMSAKGGELTNFAGAISVQPIISFAPELFGKKAGSEK